MTVIVNGNPIKMTREKWIQNRKAFARKLEKQWSAPNSICKRSYAYRETLEYVKAIAFCGEYSRVLDYPQNEEVQRILTKYGLIE